MITVNNPNKIISFTLLWQLIAVYLMAVGVWPQSIAWVSFGVLAALIVFLKPYDALKLFILSLPFYVALPNQYTDTLSMWRPLVLILFVVITIKQWRVSGFNLSGLGKYLNVKILFQKLISWDRWLLLFAGLILLSTLIARYRTQSLKEFIFLCNAAALYIAARLILKSKAQLRGVISATAMSFGIIVALGYVQYIATFFSSQYYFWQYWAIRVSSLYYGQSLADVLAYSNSWFSTSGGGSSLRMFSIMPDSHSFAMVAALFIGFVLSLIVYRAEDKKRSRVLWVLVVFGALAIMLAGTRGVWVGMLAGVVVALFLYARRTARSAMKLNLVAYGIILLCFVVSPLISQGLGYIRSVGSGSFLERASSVYDLSEQSNVGRLEIWKESSLFALTHPLGVGYGNFIVSLVQDIPEGTSIEAAGELPNKRYNLPQKFVTAHSLYLHTLVELGVLGLLALGGFILSLLFAFWKYVRLHSGAQATYVATIGLVLVWFFAYGVFDVTLFNDKILLYTFISLGLGATVLRGSFKETN